MGVASWAILLEVGPIAPARNLRGAGALDVRTVSCAMRPPIVGTASPRIETPTPERETTWPTLAMT
jgi:hypothetical protein